MKDQDIITLLNKLKNDPEYNRSFDVEQSWKLVSERCGFTDEVTPASYGVRDYIEFYVWQFSHVVAKPLAMSMAAFVLLIGGWMGAGVASANALPGDQFYPLKLTLEKAQLAVAFTPKQKAKLQVEFTSRRLEEMVEIAATSYENDPTAVRLAVNQFKEDVQTIQKDLQVKTATSTQTELAKQVGRKAQAYKSTVADSSTNLSDEVKNDVKEVQKIIDETKEDAVQVIITAHETDGDEAITSELKNTFEKDVADLNTHALTVKQKIKLETAVTLEKDGSYRRAFEVLKEVQIELEK